MSAFISFNSFTQATLFQDDFELGNTSWTSTGDLTPNYWIFNSCAGNGTSAAGTESMYITPGGSVPGCGATGTEQYAYASSASGSLQIISYTTIDATCVTTVDVNYDYRIEGNSGTDFAELVYSTNSGASWNAVGGEFSQSAGWTTGSTALPGGLAGTTFWLGFRFTYDDVTVSGAPIAIDNVVVSGTDNISPTVVCPSNPELPVNLSCEPVMDDYTKEVLFLSDNCTDSVDIVLTQSIPEFTILGGAVGSTQDITITAFDEAGNSSQCMFTLTIVDNFAPTVLCPGDTTLPVNNSCEATLPDYTSDATISDNCTSLANMIVNQSPAAGTSISGSGVVTAVTITIEDESGNTDACVFNVTTIDTTVASITCPADITLYAGGSCTSLLDDYTGLAVVSDNCVSAGSLSVSQSPVPGTSISADQIITLTVTGGVPATPQSCTFNGVFVDTTSPTITCPAVVPPLYVDGSCSVAIPDYSAQVIVTDNCPSSLIISQNPTVGTIVSTSGDVVVTMTVTDGDGNTDFCIFSQSVLDTISPTVTCPVDQTTVGDLNCVGTVSDYTGMISAFDNCSSNLTLSQSPPFGSTISSSTVITVYVEDENSNIGSCTFNLDIIDNTDPVITCPGDLTASANSSCEYIMTDYSGLTSVTDNCSSSFTYSQSPSIGATLNTGVTSVSITVFDESGNSSVCNFNLDVQDLTAPSITCPGNQMEMSDANCQGTLGDYTSLVSVSDNCSTAGNITISQSPASGTQITSSANVTMTATDEAGNESTCQFTVSLQDTMAPTITCPGPYTLAINSSCEYLIPDFSDSITGIDNCSALSAMTIIQSPIAGATGDGLTTMLITLFDEQGNSDMCTFNLIPDDNQAPVVTCPNPAPVDLGTNCDYTLTSYTSQTLVLDNCPNYVLTQSPPAGTTLNPGMNTITMTAVDAGGNVGTCSFVLEITENSSPSITCPNDVTSCDSIVTYSDPTFNDNCFAYLTQTDGTGLSSGSAFPVGITQLEYTVADSSGNSQTCAFNIEVLPSPDPAVILEDTIWVCDATSTVLNADPVSSGGEWVFISGTGTFNNQFANVTGINNLNQGNTVVAWTVTSASCGTDADTVVINVADLPSNAVIQDDTLYSCNTELVDLTANAPVIGSGYWTVLGDASVDDTYSFDTFASLNASGWTWFYWTVGNGGCPTTTDSVVVLANLEPEIFTNDTIVCFESDTLIVEGTNPAAGQDSYWSFLSGSGTIVDPDSSITAIYGMNLGTNWLVYTMSIPSCPDIQDTLIVISNLCDGFSPIIPTVITPNYDSQNDVFEISHLEDVYPNCHVVIFNRWGSVVFESDGYSQPWDGTFQGEKLPMGTYFYSINLNDENNTVIRGDVSIIH